MSRRLVVDNLINEVRSMLDEENRANINDTKDILPALNRAQDYATNILARHYEAPLMTYEMLDLTSGVDMYDLPEGAFEQRLEKVEVFLQQVYYPVKRIDYRDVTLYETPTRNNIPYYYTIIGNQFRLIPQPTATYPLRIWYMKDPEPLVKQEGRVNLISIADNYIRVDEVGSSLTSELNNLDAYVNLVDGDSGTIKATMQVKSISEDGKIIFKSDGDLDRDSVLNKPVTGTIPDSLNKDDYICLVHGSCIPYMKKPLANFLIQYAVAEIRRKLGGPADMELRVLKDLEEQVERSWVGREQTRRVNKRNRSWATPGRRYFNNI